MSAVSAVETAGSSTRPSPTSAATGASTPTSGPTRVPSVASATRPRWALRPWTLAPDPRSAGSPAPGQIHALFPASQHPPPPTTRPLGPFPGLRWDGRVVG